MAKLLSPALPAFPLGRLMRRIAFVLDHLARDFWKDGRPQLRQPASHPLHAAPRPTKTGSAAGRAPPPHPATKHVTGWHASRADVLEKLWGPGCTVPGHEHWINQFYAVLGLNASMNVLDLSAGLGAQARRLAADTGAYFTALDTDADLIERGRRQCMMAGLSSRVEMEAYTPATFKAPRNYDSVLAREILYKVEDKKTFVQAVAEGLKPRGQVVFTDFILNPPFDDQDAVKAWLACEQGAAPVSLEAMTGLWTEAGFDVRVNEDLTPQYRREIIRALGRFTQHLLKHKPDTETAPVVLGEVELWARRAMALEQGLTFCRFYAIKS